VLKKKLSLLIIFFAISSCSGVGIDFDPDFYFPDVENQRLENEKFIKIPFTSNEMNDFACMSSAKLKELKEILNSATIPRKEKNKILNILNKAINK